jgi:hypothetical protein
MKALCASHQLAETVLESAFVDALEDCEQQRRFASRLIGLVAPLVGADITRELQTGLESCEPGVVVALVVRVAVEHQIDLPAEIMEYADDIRHYHPETLATLETRFTPNH